MDKEILLLINKFLESKLLKEEQKKLEDWVLKGENRAILKDYFQQYYVNKEFDYEKAFKLFQIKIEQKEGTKFIHRIKKEVFLKYAAIFIGFIFISYFSFVVMNKSENAISENNKIVLEIEDGSYYFIDDLKSMEIKTKKGEIIGGKENGKLSFAKKVNLNLKPVLATIRIPKGEKYRLQLSDKSYVYLNAGSSLSFPSRFYKGEQREVFLDGEGYFEISKDEKAPFIVRTSSLSTQVFGTKFNVSSYKSDEKTEVALLEGSIGVYDQGDFFNINTGVKLKPSEIASKFNEKIIKSSSKNINNHIAWVDGILIFRDENFNSIIQKLERRYNVVITNNNKELTNKRFTASFQFKDIDSVLLAFQKTNNFNFKKVDNNIIIN